MTYRSLLERLFNARRAGVELGLERIERALDAIGRPQEHIPVRVQIGGTNGKGSTGAFVEAALREAGYRVGLFSSPHLSRFSERFRVDGTPAAEDAIVDAAEHVAGVVDDLTFFEQTTLIAVALLVRAGVDVAIFEVGLGGRLDATSALDAQVAAVTGVALDHQDYLGSTLAAIAREKAGIFRVGQHAVIGRSGEPEAVPMLAAHARSLPVAALTVVDRPVPPDWRLGLAGDHQRDNAACARAILRHLSDLGRARAGERTIRQGFARARLPGRFEQIADDPVVIVDGAHNPHAASTLANEIASMARPVALVLAVSRDKDVPGILSPLLAVADAVFATQFAQPRSLASTELAEQITRLDGAPEPESFAQIEGALARAVDRVGPSGTVVVTGSLFVVGEARRILCGDASDPVVVTDPVGRR